MSNNLISFKASLQKVLASFLCLLLFNAAMSCWQHAAAQPDVQTQQQHADMQMMPCHQLKDSQQRMYGLSFNQLPASPPAQQNRSDTTDNILHISNIASADHSKHMVGNHQCALNCSPFTPAAELAQQIILIGSLLPASKPVDLTANPLQAWRQNPERPPQFLI